MADNDEWRSFTAQQWLRSPTPKPRYVEFFLQEDVGKPKLLWERFVQPFLNGNMPTTKVFCPNAIVTHQLKDYVNKKLEGLAGEMIRTITPKILEVSRGKNDCANTIRLWNEGKVKLVLVDRQYENAEELLDGGETCIHFKFPCDAFAFTTFNLLKECRNCVFYGMMSDKGAVKGLKFYFEHNIGLEVPAWCDKLRVVTSFQMENVDGLKMKVLLPLY